MSTKIERHPQGKNIIMRLASGEQNSGILPDFPAITGDDLDYYRLHKLGKVLSKSPELKAEIEGEFGDDTLAEVRVLKTKAIKILDQAQGAGDLGTALKGIREARGCLETILEAEGRIRAAALVNVSLQQTTVNINQSPAWIAHETRVIKALEAFPEARAAVVRALR